jgi:hypothetical protein
MLATARALVALKSEELVRKVKIVARALDCCFEMMTHLPLSKSDSADLEC